MTRAGNIQVDTGLGVTVPKGFRAGAAACGLKETGAPDVAVLVCETDAQAAAVFTQNRVVGAPVLVSRERLSRGRAMRGIVVNSGNSNACTGEQGLADAREMTRLAAEQIGCAAEQMLVASTGVIGHALPMGKIERGIRAACAALASGPEADDAFARAIMTTDTRPKQAGARVQIGGRAVTIAGATKGVGMIAPNMATTLGFLATDATVAASLLQMMLCRAADATYNCLTVDGHTSTSDTLVLMASGRAGAEAVAKGSPEAETFEVALAAVCESLARQIVADAEGGTKVIEIRVTGAASEAEARRAARAIADSPLVKCAFFGEDPNWGRIVSAAGAAGISSEPETMRLMLGGVVLFDGGGPVEADAKRLETIMKAHEIAVHLDLGAGTGEARCLTCDLTDEYVRINAHYTT
ncbi:MAG: bifunctional glutamate N-acetyltransferase/amino-acid acetyltransferase ArgJ [Phycisphaerae bacterium]